MFYRNGYLCSILITGTSRVTIIINNNRWIAIEAQSQVSFSFNVVHGLRCATKMCRTFAGHRSNVGQKSFLPAPMTHYGYQWEMNPGSRTARSTNDSLWVPVGDEPRFTDCKIVPLTIESRIRISFSPWSRQWAEGTCWGVSGTKLRRCTAWHSWDTLEAAEITSLCHEQRTGVIELELLRVVW